MSRTALLAAAALLAFAAPATVVAAQSAALTRPAPSEDAVLKAVAAARSEAARERDQYRRPVEALTFWGLRPGMTVLEVGPGGGWWSDILGPYLKQTGGRFIVTGPDVENPNISEAAKKARADLETKFADPKYAATVWNFGPTSKPLPEPGSVDLILVARAVQNMARAEGMVDKSMRDFAAALKPGGVLAVEQHRAAPGSELKPTTGYVPESFVIAAAEKAGLQLDARSEMNANPRDDRDHPFGVWTLQPVRTSEGDGRKLTDAERAAFDAIGESDRMTLRFVKPA